MGASAVRTVTLSHGKRAAETLAKGYEQPFRTLPAQGPQHVIAEADGTLIRIVEPGPRKGKRPRDWKELRLLAAQAKDSSTAVYAATHGTVVDAGRRWGHCAKQAGWSLSSRVHIVADGAEWIHLQAQEVFGTQGSFLCDFFHVSEYLGAAAPKCRTEKPEQWRRTQQRRLRRGKAGKVVDALAEHLEPKGTPDEEAPVHKAHRYLTNRQDSLDYPRALELGLPIGSGLIESGHRHVLQARLKKPGIAWLRVHAHDVAQLRVLRANRQWENFWN